MRKSIQVVLLIIYYSMYSLAAECLIDIDQNDVLTLNNASDYRTNGLYRTYISNPNPKPSPVVR